MASKCRRTVPVSPRDVGPVRLADAPAATARVRVHAGYLSSHESVVRFGLGDASDTREVEVTWPSGARERFSDLALDSIHHLRQGSGTPVEGQE